MRRLAIGLALAALLLVSVLATASAEAYTALLEDSNLRISVSYPPEVKAGTCFTLRFEAQAFSSYTIDSIRLTLIFHRGGGSETLYDQVLVSSEAVTSGWSFSKNIDICVPGLPDPEPFIEAELSATYTLPAPETRQLTNEWYMTIVRRQTYEEVLSELEESRRKVNKLEDKIDDLLDEIDDLQEQVEELQESLESLSESYESLSSDYRSLQESYGDLQESYQQLQQRYSELEEEYGKVSEEYRQALVDYERLRTMYEMLSENHSQLQSNYHSLLDDYQSLSKELSQLQSVHEDLSSRYNELKERHESSLQTIGQLQETINDLEERLREKQEELDTLSAMYHSAVNEGTLTKNILYAQSAAVAGIGAGIFLISLRKKRVPPPPPPPSPNQPRDENMGNGNGRVQKVLSGRRVTLPKEVVEKLGIREGGRVRVEVLDDSVRITPVKEE